MANLGQLLFAGRGCAPSRAHREEGLRYLRQAAAKGHMLAQHQLVSILRQTGQGAEADRLQAPFEAAAAPGDEWRSRMMLATPDVTALGAALAGGGLIAELPLRAKEEVVGAMAITADRMRDKASRREWATAAGTSAAAIGGAAGMSAQLQQELSALAAVARTVCLGCGGTQGAEGAALLVCAGCKIARFCSKECQRAMWSTHKTSCAKWRARE